MTVDARFTRICCGVYRGALQVDEARRSAHPGLLRVCDGPTTVSCEKTAGLKRVVDKGLLRGCRGVDEVPMLVYCGDGADQ